MKELAVEDQQLINQLVTERNLKEGAYRRFKSPVTKYLEFHENKYTMTQLINQAQEEQDNGINPQKTRLYTYLTDFRLYLNDKLSPRTLQNYMIQIKEIYRHYDVIVPTLKPFKLRQEKQVTYDDLPSKKDIQNALTISTIDMRALILFQSSSGTTLHESLTITVKMFLEACKEYTENDTYSDGSIKHILNQLKQQEGIVPIFNLERVKTNKYYYTCCSPEASKEIISYLLFRLDQEEKLTLDSKVFPYYKNVYTKRFWSLNQKLGLGFVGKYSKFRSHALRKFHASNIGCSVELIDELQGRGKSIIHEAYIKDRPQKIRQEYMKYMNNILIFDDKTQNKKSRDVQQVDKEEPKMDTVQVTVDNDLVFQLIKQIGKLEQRIEQLEKEEVKE